MKLRIIAVVLNLWVSMVSIGSAVLSHSIVSFVLLSIMSLICCAVAGYNLYLLITEIE